MEYSAHQYHAHLSSHASPALGEAASDSEFVGREGELLVIAEALEAACDGHGSSALIEGEPGIGKSRLAEEVSSHAEGRGIKVLWSRCFEGETIPPFGVWSAVLRPYIRAAVDAGSDWLHDPLAGDLRWLLPELGEIWSPASSFSATETDPLDAPPSPPPLSVDDGRRRLTESILFAVRSINQPCVVVIDNLHRADAGSLSTLRHLAPELPNLPVLLLVTMRSHLSPPRREVALTCSELAKCHAFRRLELRGLAPPEVARLLLKLIGENPDSETTSMVWSRTEGNPFFAIQLGRHLRVVDQERRWPPAQLETVLPLGVIETVEERLGALARPCRQFFQGAAVLGRRFDPTVALALCTEVSESKIDDYLESAYALGIVEPGEGTEPSYRFSHAILRDVILAGTPSRRRAHLHQRAAEALESLQQEDPRYVSQEILRHLLASTPLCDPQALIRWTHRAVDDVLQLYGPGEALDILDEVFGAWDRTGRVHDERIAGLYHRRGIVLTDLDRAAEAKESLVRSFDIYVDHGMIQEAVAVATTPAKEPTRGGMWVGSAVGGRGVAELREQALALVESGTREHALLLMDRMTRADLRASIALARRTDDLDLESNGLVRLAYHELLAYEFDECERVLSAAESTAGQCGNARGLQGCAYTRYCLSVGKGDRIAISEALRALFEGAERHRSWLWRVVAHRCACSTAMHTGCWQEAEEQGMRCLDLLRSGRGPTFNRIITLLSLAKVAVFRGDSAGAKHWMAKRSATVGAENPPDERRVFEIARLSGSSDGFPEPPVDIEAPDTDGSLLLYAPSYLTGDVDAAIIHNDKRAAEHYVEILKPWGGLFANRPIDAQLGLLSAVLGRVDEAISYLNSSVDFCRNAGFRPHLAWSLYELGNLLRCRGQAEDCGHARSALTEALELSESLDMAPLAAATAAMIEECYTHPRRSSTYGITDREREVLRLVAGGYSNADIGTYLHISPLTAARHVHNLLEKTQTANRAALTAWGANHNLLSPEENT